MPTRLLWAALLVAALLPTGQSYGQVSDTTVLRLDALLETAERHNPSLEAARLQAQALAQRPAQAGAFPDPTAGLTYQPRPLLTARGYQRSQWQVQQQIPFPGKRRLRREVATLGARVAASDAEAVGQELALEIKRSFYTLYRTQEQARLIRQFRTQLDGFEDAATTRYEVGEGAQQAILKAQIERGRLSVKLEALTADRQSALDALARLTGRSDLDGSVGPVEAALPPKRQETDSLALAALEARPEAKALRQSIAQAERRADLARKAFLPDFTLGVTYFDLGSADLSPAMTGRDALAVKAGVSVPLWLGKQRANLAEAQLQRQQTRARLDAFRLDIQTELGDLQNQLERQQRQLALLGETLIPQAETALEATLSSYSAGRTDFLDLLDAQRTLFQLRMDDAATHARFLKTSAKLEHTLGRATLSDGP